MDRVCAALGQALEDLTFASGRTMNLSLFLLEYFTDIIVDFIMVLQGVTRLSVNLTPGLICNVNVMDNN
jgi:hypothetical protein